MNSDYNESNTANKYKKKLLRSCTRSIAAIIARILVVLSFATRNPAQERNPPALKFPNIQLPSPKLVYDPSLNVETSDSISTP